MDDRNPLKNDPSNIENLWGFKPEGAYHFSNTDSVTPFGANLGFFNERSCHCPTSEQNNDLSEIGWNWVRYFATNFSSTENHLKNILGDNALTP